VRFIRETVLEMCCFFMSLYSCCNGCYSLSILYFYSTNEVVSCSSLLHACIWILIYNNAKCMARVGIV
jgi:hypothetical protein